MTYEQAKAERDRIEQDLKEASTALDAFPTLPNGLHPDHVKQDPAYQQAKARSAAAFANLRAFNTVFAKTFKREILEERSRRTPSGK